MADEKKKSKIELPLTLGSDLNSAREDEPALNQSNKGNNGKWISGSSNREGGYDMHPHKGDHGEAQTWGSNKLSDYNGPEDQRDDDDL